jgi:hypothetical protein
MLNQIYGHFQGNSGTVVLSALSVLSAVKYNFFAADTRRQGEASA